MNMGRVGVLAGDKITAYHENQATDQNYFSIIKPEFPPNLAFMTKGMLIKEIELMAYEIAKLKLENEELKRQSRKNRQELSKALSEVLFYQQQALELQNKILEHYGIEDKPYMKVAE